MLNASSVHRDDATKRARTKSHKNYSPKTGKKVSTSPKSPTRVIPNQSFKGGLLPLPTLSEKNSNARSDQKPDRVGFADKVGSTDRVGFADGFVDSPDLLRQFHWFNEHQYWNPIQWKQYLTNEWKAYHHRCVNNLIYLSKLQEESTRTGGVRFPNANWIKYQQLCQEMKHSFFQSLPRNSETRRISSTKATYSSNSTKKPIAATEFVPEPALNLVCFFCNGLSRHSLWCCLPNSDCVDCEKKQEFFVLCPSLNSLYSCTKCGALRFYRWEECEIDQTKGSEKPKSDLCDYNIEHDIELLLEEEPKQKPSKPARVSTFAQGQSSRGPNNSFRTCNSWSDMYLPVIVNLGYQSNQ